jgi:hypothetical protein
MPSVGLSGEQHFWQSDSTISTFGTTCNSWKSRVYSSKSGEGWVVRASGGLGAGSRKDRIVLFLKASILRWVRRQGG